MTHRIEATCASPNGIEAKCASPRWRPNPEIDWHRDRYPRDMINPAGRNHVIKKRVVVKKRFLGHHQKSEKVPLKSADKNKF